MTELKLEPGEACVVLREHRNSGGTGTIENTTIERVLKRDVVLANGARFNKDRLQIANGTWESPTLLLHPRDARVGRVRAANTLAVRAGVLRKALDAAEQSLRARDVDGAIEALRATIDQLSPTEGANQ